MLSGVKKRGVWEEIASTPIASAWAACKQWQAVFEHQLLPDDWNVNPKSGCGLILWSISNSAENNPSEK